MLPQDGQLSSRAQISGFAYPVKGPLPEDKLQDWELGGVALNDPSQGLMVKVWHLQATKRAESDDVDVIVSAPGVAPTLLFTAPGITEVALAFDQNMNPFVAYHQGDDAKIYWYDPTIPGMTHTTLPSGIRTMRCTMDERRSAFVADSDIVLSYIRAGNLCVRYQRDRYQTEYVLRAGVGANCQLVSMARNRGNRLQWRLRNYELTDDPGALLSSVPFLGEIVENVCLRASMPRERVDVSDIFGTPVRGLTIGNAYAASGTLQSLSSVFFFDPSSAGGKVHFVPRGADAKATIYEDDMIDNSEPVEDGDSRRGDPIAIPRVLHLNYYDVAGGLNTDKQRSERPEGTRAEGEQSLQTPVVLSADEAATVVARTHGLMVEQQKGELNFSLPDNWLHLTESDPVFVQTGTKMVRAIITRVETNDGEQRYTAIRDRQSLYTTQVQGIPAAPVTRPPSSVAGPTIIEFLDIPILRDTHDQLGFYLAVSGILPAWPGAYVELSLDGGQNYIDGQTTRTGSVIGELVTPLGDHPHEFPDTVNRCEIKIKTPNELLTSTDLAGMLNRRNRAIIGDEIVNFADVDEVTPGVWDVGHWLRGRLGTDAVAHSIGERFVLLDTAMFIPAELSWLGRDLTFRATTLGRPVDEATIITVPFTGASQTERRPAYLSARRDGADAVISWQGVGRLGAGANVAMGAYFQGYRVTLTDGITTQTHDTTANALTTSLSAFTGPVTIRVQQRNQITGLGPYIEVTI